MEWPKCETCKGDKVVEREIKDGISFSYNEPYRDHIACPACGGTGERDLTADEAADMLPGCMKITKWWYVRGSRYSYYIEWGPGIDNYRCGETLTAALNAAARAICERRGK